MVRSLWLWFVRTVEESQAGGAGSTEAGRRGRGARTTAKRYTNSRRSRFEKNDLRDIRGNRFPFSSIV